MGYNPIIVTPGSADNAPAGAGKANGMFAELYQRSPGGLLSYTSPSGASNDLAIPNLDGTVGRLEVTITANTNWTGLAAGNDGQPLYITLVAGNFLFTLNKLNGASQSANQFRAPADMTLDLNDTYKLVYYGNPVNKWVIVP